MKQLLIISGLEANGFAGLLTDVQVAINLSLTPSAIATTLTAQSPTQLLSVQAAEADLISAQLLTLDCQPQVIKIGLLPSKEVAQAIADWLEQTEMKARPYVVLDPVLTSSGDHKAFTSKAIGDVIEPLLPWVSLLTPNINELKHLTGNSLADVSDFETAAAFFYKRPGFNGKILLTGGHSELAVLHKTVIDTLYERSDQRIKESAHWSQPRLPFQLRGTGCFLSTAIASALCHQYSELDAITLANAHLHNHFQNSQQNYRIRHCRAPENNDWPTDQSVYPTIIRPEARFPYGATRVFPPLNHKRGIYPVVDSSSWVKRLAQQGIKTIQLRVKDKPLAFIRGEIKAAVEIAQLYSLQLFINDYWQLAIELKAYGVHLGQEDILNADLEKIQKAGLRLGISTHGDFEFLFGLQLNPSYVAIGAIFPTKTKDMTGKIQGLERLTRYCSLEKEIPIVAIGGIHSLNIKEVLNTGASMVAVVSAIQKSDSPESSTQKLQKACQAHREELLEHV